MLSGRVHFRCFMPNDRWCQPPEHQSASRQSALCVSSALRYQTTPSRGRSGVQLAPDDLARRLLGEVPVPARAQRRHQEQPAPALLLRIGRAVFAEIFRCRGPRLRIPDFDEDAGAVARQPQADSRLVDVSRRSLYGIGNQLGDQELGSPRRARSIPTPTAGSWHAAGRTPPRWAQRRAQGSYAAATGKVPARRDGEQGRRRSVAQDHRAGCAPGTTPTLLLIPVSAPTTPDLSQGGSVFHGVRSMTCLAAHGALSGSEGRDRPADSPAMLSGRAHFRSFMPNDRWCQPQNSTPRADSQRCASRQPSQPVHQRHARP